MFHANETHAKCWKSYVVSITVQQVEVTYACKGSSYWAESTACCGGGEGGGDGGGGNWNGKKTKKK